MFFNHNTLFVLLALTLSSTPIVRSHGTIVKVAGANGVQAAGFGIIADTPRTGTRRNPFQQDTSIIRDREIASGTAGACGRTLAGGNNDVAAQLAAASQAGLPTANAAGGLSMTLHQINGDGAGPYTCEVSTDGGNTFSAATVTTQVPGNNGRSRAKAQDFPLVAAVPAGTTCAAGPDGNACIMRCRNPSRAGPFGSCVAFTMGDAAGTGAANSTVLGGAAGTGAAKAKATVLGDAAGTGAANSAVAAEAPAASEAAAAANAAVDGQDEEEEDVTDAPATAAAANTGGNAKQGGLGGTVGGAAGRLGSGAGKAGGIGDLVSGLIGNKLAPKRRYLNSRVVGKRGNYWM